MTATLEITQKKSWFGAMRKISLLIDGKAAAELSNGQTTTLPVSPGNHTFEVQLGPMGSAPARMEFAGGGTMQLGCQPKMGLFATGDLILTRTDGSVVEGTAGPKRHHGRLVIAFGLLGFLIGLFGLASLFQGIVDLKQMRIVKMDPSGRSLTAAGTILGGLGFALNVIGLIFTLTS
jgi:hypothetical protein